jgi:hypothetical protein
MSRKLKLALHQSQSLAAVPVSKPAATAPPGFVPLPANFPPVLYPHGPEQGAIFNGGPPQNDLEFLLNGSRWISLDVAIARARKPEPTFDPEEVTCGRFF